MPRDRYVWRVQDEDGWGPYSERRPKSLSRKLEALPAAKACHPFQDFPPYILAALQINVGAYRFGFRSRAQAREWFGEMLPVLEERGFRLRRVRADRVWLSRSGRQVMFTPDRSTGRLS